MKYANVYAVAFSPTGSSKKVAQTIAAGIGGAPVTFLDLTLPEDRESSYTFAAQDLLVLSLPVYGGRIPLPVVSALKKMRGSNTPIVLAAVYGNRAYEDALLEMSNMMKEQGFHPIAAGAFIAEHSKSPLVGTGRPNPQDIEMMTQFGQKIAQQLEKGIPEEAALSVPGNFPYKERSPKAPFAPVTSDACIGCGACARVCPVDAISEDDPKYSDPAKCILCQACEKVCTVNARSLTAEPVLKMTKWLEENCQKQLPNELFYCV